MNNTNYYDKYKEDISQHQDSNKIVINKTKEYESFIKQLTSMNFKQNVIKYVIDIVISCGGKMIELEK